MKVKLLLLAAYACSVMSQVRSQERCSCVSPYKCIPSSSSISNQNEYVTCEDPQKVCCKNSHIKPMNLSTIVKPQNVEQKPSVLKRCGTRNLFISGRSEWENHSENQARFTEFPWMVAIMSQDVMVSKYLKYLTYKCGGSLIHPKVVLTAAHCVKRRPARTLKIRAGQYDMQSSAEAYSHQDRSVATVIINPYYRPGLLHNDHAILILSEPVELTDTVDVICLPEPHMRFDNSDCVMTGWGSREYTSTAESPHQAVLKKIKAPIIDSQTCLKSFRHRLHYLHNSYICAGGEAAKDHVCDGDEGSPLVCLTQSDPVTYYQAGILAWGVDNWTNLPGRYADVAKIRSWIDTQFDAHNLDKSYYIHHP